MKRDEQLDTFSWDGVKIHCKTDAANSIKLDKDELDESKALSVAWKKTGEHVAFFSVKDFLWQS
jgi:hypothetical protein